MFKLTAILASAIIAGLMTMPSPASAPASEPTATVRYCWVATLETAWPCADVWSETDA